MSHGLGAHTVSGQLDRLPRDTLKIAPWPSRRAEPPRPAMWASTIVKCLPVSRCGPPMNCRKSRRTFWRRCPNGPAEKAPSGRAVAPTGRGAIRSAIGDGQSYDLADLSMTIEWEKRRLCEVPAPPRRPRARWRDATRSLEPTAGKCAVVALRFAPGLSGHGQSGAHQARRRPLGPRANAELGPHLPMRPPPSGCRASRTRSSINSSAARRSAR
jgi:hypothetical protein